MLVLSTVLIHYGAKEFCINFQIIADVPIIFTRNYMDLAVFRGKSFKVGWKMGKTFLMYHNEFEPPETIEFEDISEEVPDRCRKINILELDNTNYDVKITPAEV